MPTAPTETLPSQRAKKTLVAVLMKYVDSEKADQLAEIFVDAELDGVRSHGLARFPRFIDEVKQGFIKPTNEPSRENSFGGWEMWNGNAGAGPLSALHCAKRAVSIAQEFGIACVGLRNTNHWLRPGYYSKLAAKQDCAFIAWSNTMPNMRAHGASKTTLGNTPLSIALPGQDDQQITLLDMALSQFSYGKMQGFADNNQPLPTVGGYDDENTLSDDATTIIANQSASAVGLWKGSALALVLDLLGVFLGGGKSVYEIGTLPGEQEVSQVFIAIALHKLWEPKSYLERLTQLKDQLKATDSTVHTPGEKLNQIREHHLSAGITIPSGLWNKIQQLKSE